MSHSTWRPAGQTATNTVTEKLTGHRIKLLPFDESDRDLFMELSMSPIMTRHVCNPLTIEEAKAAFYQRAKPWNINTGGQLTLSINEILSGEKLGNIALKICDARIAEVGVMIKPGAQGKGFASEALSVLAYYVFTILEFNKLVAVCSSDNISSCKALEKAGFIQEGFLRKNTFIQGKYVDDYMYGLCK